MDEIGYVMYIEDITRAASCQLPWYKLSGKNILITGATGLIGSAVIDILMARREVDYHVFALGRNVDRANKLFSSYFESSFFHFIQHDIINPLPTNFPYHYIIHAASGANPIIYSTDPVGVMKANIYGTENLLSYGKNHNLEKFVFVSSGDIYGEGDGRKFTENYSGYVNPLELRSCYSSSKRATETLCIAYGNQYGIDVSIARPSHTYGPHFTESDTRVYAQFINNVVKGENIVMKSSGEQYRSWCYVVDCALGILYIALKGESGIAYNVADENSNITIRELAEMIANIAGKHVILELPLERELAGFNPATKSCFDTLKLRSLGWLPSATMKDNIVTTIKERLVYEN